MGKYKTGKAIPFLVIELDRPRKIRLGMSAIVEFEMLTGEKVMAINKDSNFEVLMKLLWVMLKQEDKELTFEGTLELIDEYGGSLTEIMSFVGEVISIAFGADEKAVLEVVGEDKPTK